MKKFIIVATAILAVILGLQFSLTYEGFSFITGLRYYSFLSLWDKASWSTHFSLQEELASLFSLPLFSSRKLLFVLQQGLFLSVGLLMFFWKNHARIEPFYYRTLQCLFLTFAILPSLTLFLPYYIGPIISNTLSILYIISGLLGVLSLKGPSRSTAIPVTVKGLFITNLIHFILSLFIFPFLVYVAITFLAVSPSDLENGFGNALLPQFAFFFLFLYQGAFNIILFLLNLVFLMISHKNKLVKINFWWILHLIYLLISPALPLVLLFTLTTIARYTITFICICLVPIVGDLILFMAYLPYIKKR